MLAEGAKASPPLGFDYGGELGVALIALLDNQQYPCGDENERYDSPEEIFANLGMQFGSSE
jgi:hypothetical protein